MIHYRYSGSGRKDGGSPRGCYGSQRLSISQPSEEANAGLARHGSSFSYCAVLSQSFTVTAAVRMCDSFVLLIIHGRSTCSTIQEMRTNSINPRVQDSASIIHKRKDFLSGYSKIEWRWGFDERLKIMVRWRFSCTFFFFLCKEVNSSLKTV